MLADVEYFLQMGQNLTAQGKCRYSRTCWFVRALNKQYGNLELIFAISVLSEGENYALTER